MPAGTTLFLEATQLKTERTIIEVVKADVAAVETQEKSIGTLARNGRRPPKPVSADVIQLTRPIFGSTPSAVAEARGRVPLGTPAGAFSAKFRRPAPESGKCERKKT